jgi:hypothetical protein
MTLVGRTLAMASNSRTNYYAAALGRALVAARDFSALWELEPRCGPRQYSGSRL